MIDFPRPLALSSVARNTLETLHSSVGVYLEVLVQKRRVTVDNRQKVRGELLSQDIKNFMAKGLLLGATFCNTEWNEQQPYYVQDVLSGNPDCPEDMTEPITLYHAEAQDKHTGKIEVTVFVEDEHKYVNNAVQFSTKEVIDGYTQEAEIDYVTTEKYLHKFFSGRNPLYLRRLLINPTFYGSGGDGETMRIA